MSEEGDKMDTAPVEGQTDVAIKSTVKPAEHGWAPKTAYNYEVYNAASREEREALEAAMGGPTSWASSAKKYEWQDEFGDVGPAIPELEEQLFGSEHLVRSGIEFDKVKEINVLQEGSTQIKPVSRFEDAGLHPIMLENVRLCQYNVTTPVQAYCIPAVLQGYDVMGSAQTGSGKTAAFLVPALSKLMGKARKLCGPRPNYRNPAEGPEFVRAEPLILIVAPTRELATQIFDEARRFCYRSMLRPCVVYGGVPLGVQRAELEKGCDVLIGTPGRLCDFMDRGHVLSLSRVKYTVIDEADEMLASNWQDELKKLMSGGDTNEDADHVYMMFSATFPKDLRRLAREYLANDHFRVRVGRPGSTAATITQQIFWVSEEKKKVALYDLLMDSPPARTIIFVNAKRTADLVDDYLFNLDLPCTSIHADRTQREREDALLAFRRGKTPILVATGVSARGLDISSILHVINYDLPSTMHGSIEEYVHRIGRTARIGNKGLATSFYNDRNEDLAPKLVLTLLETKQDVPDFLEMYIPEGARQEAAKLDFEDESDPEDAEEDANGGDGFGSGSFNPAPQAGFGDFSGGDTANAASGDAWGTEDKPAEGGGGEAW